MAENLYDVDEIRRIQDITKGGRFKEVVEVTFTTRSGFVDTIKIPAEDYNPASVKSIITKMAQVHEDIATGK